MDTLAYILDKYSLSVERRLPIEIPDVGRDDLPTLFRELNFKVGAEIGVEQGAYAELLCQANPDLTLYGIDPWIKYRGYRDHVNQDKLDGFFQTAQDRMASYDWRPIRKFSVGAVEDFHNRSLDFVYIDGNHLLQYVVTDITVWEKKVRKGGIISGHDYRKTKTSYAAHVTQAVRAYTDAYRIRPWFVLGSKNIVRGETRDKNRSWMWVKQ